MKKIITLLLAASLFSFTTKSFAQDSTKVKKVKAKKATTVVATTPTTATPPAPDATAAKTKTNPPTVVTKKTTTATSTDKVFGKDAKGRTIYEGKEGGHYYLNASGNKTYVKKTTTKTTTN